MDRGTRTWRRASFIAAVLLTGVSAPAVAEFVPGTYLFSLRAGSPSPFSPSDILRVNPAVGGAPTILIPGGIGGLGLQPGDDVDAITYKVPKMFPIVFTVDRSAVGKPGSPVATEAAVGQAAADTFLLSETPQWDPVVSPLNNQSDLGLLPTVPRGIPVAPPIDDIDGLETRFPTDPGVFGLYYSLARNSPTLAALGASPADVLTTVNGMPSIWLRFSSRLLPGDDIDALDMDPFYDSIGYSFSPDSPSVLTGEYAAGDLIKDVVSDNDPNNLFPIVVWRPEDLGLLPNDNLDDFGLGDPNPPALWSPPICWCDEKAPFVAIPEPTAFLLCILSMGMMGLRRLRREVL